MKYITFIINMAVIVSHAYSQGFMNNWYFGDYAGLNFSGGSPVYQFSPMRSYEANASVSDSLGNLLFYTNGVTIWDKYHNKMPNGDSLEIAAQFDLPFGGGSSVTQGVIILPMPGSSEKYYVFYLKRAVDFYNENSLMYSVVDMSLNGGNGDVIDGLKNIPYTPSGNYLWEKMTAVKHANGKDWWLITTSGKTVDADPTYFELFLITADGISGPTFQPYDFWSTEGWDGWVFSGQMKFSLSGNKLALTRTSQVDIYNFDRCDGTLSNRVIIDSLPIASYGLEFSKDETKLYVSSLGNNALKPYLTQICLNCNGIIKTTLYSDTKQYEFMQLQIGPDDKIYTGFDKTNVEDENERFLSFINYPDSFGLACDFQLAAFELGDSGRIRYGLPNFVNYDLGALTGADSCGAIININDLNNDSQVKIFPNPAVNYIFLADKNNNSVACEAVLFYNSTGVLVKKIIQPNGPLDVSDLAHGIYVVKVVGKAENYILKLEILK